MKKFKHISWCNLRLGTDLQILSRIFLYIFIIYTTCSISYFYFDFQNTNKLNSSLLEDQYQPPASDSLIVSEQNLKNIRLSDDFAALHEGRAESKSKRALSNNPGKFISEEYKLNYYLKQYITGGVILIGCTIFIYLYLRKYTNFKFKDLKIRLEEKINEIEMYVQTVERLNKQSANLNILLTTQKQSHSFI